MTLSNKNSNFSHYFVIFLTSFILTFFLNKYILNTDFDYINIFGKNNQINDNIKLNNNKEDLDLSNFWEVYNKIGENYYDHDDLKKSDLVSGAIKGLVESMGDKHSEYMTSKETKSFNEALSGDFEGIGAVVEKVDAGVTIGNVLKGSPALEAGLKNGDIVLKANDVELKDLSLIDAVSKIKGPAGTEVNLNIFRSGEKELLNIKVIRKKIKIPSVDSKVFEKENIGYIAINMFGETTSADFNLALQSLEKTDGLIIDLRDNGGGFLISAVEILSNFIENGKILVKTKYKNSIKNEVYNSFNDGKIYDKKIVVLINGNSASASEITAGALRDYNKAIIIGEKSYGKGSVQQPFDLSDGSMVKLTIAKWYTPKDKAIDKVGIEPDIKVSFEKEDIEKKHDRQLEESKKVLKDFIKLGALQLVIDNNNMEKK